MAGPCTLLAQPQYNRYIDAAGEHAIEWIGDSTAAPAITPDSVSTGGQFGLDFTQPPAAFSVHLGYDRPSKNYSVPSAPFSSSDSLDWLTVANGTKARVTNYTMLINPASATFPLASGEYQAFFAIDGYLRRWGADIYNAGSSVLLTATGAELMATRALLDGKGAAGSILAIVVNGASEPRTFQIMRNGVALGLPRVIPAKTIATIAQGFYNGFAAGQAVGFKVTDAVAGEKFGLFYLGCTDARNHTFPVPLVDYAPSTELADDQNGYLPIVPWAGAARQSVASEGEHFWRVPLTRAHISGGRGAIASRYLPFGWPDGPESVPIGVGRFGLTAYNDEPSYIECGISVYRQNVYDVNVLADQGYFNLTWFGISSDARLDADDNAGFLDRVTVTNPIDAPPTQFQLGLLTWDGAQITGGLDGQTLVSASRIGWEGADFPFRGVEPTADPVYLYPGYPMDYWSPSATFHRDVAIFDRPLTTAEAAFVNDPDSVWAFNMFAEPASAELTMPAEIVRGDTVRLEVTIRDAAGDAVPLPGLTFWQTWKPEGDMAPDDRNAYGTSYLAIGNDGNATAATNASVIDALEGRLELVLDAADSAAMRPGESVAVDIQAQTIEGDIVTLYRGTVAIVADVTRSTAAPA